MRNLLAASIAENLRVVFAVLATLVLSGCASVSGTTSSQMTPGASQASPGLTTTSVAKHAPRHASRPHRPPAIKASSRRPGSLPYSTASNSVAHAQPAPGFCHAIGSGLYSRPDPACTPGALNPEVTQATIDRTICVAGWTDAVRPPESITEREKAASIAAYGDTGSIGSYEYDHFVPLELGGATNDPRNLWPEPGASPNPKDAVEDELRRAVCDGQLSLGQAQRDIVTNWVSLTRRPPPRKTTRPPECTVTASYSSHYHDYDVYVHSNQPHQTVTIVDAYGHSDSWHTDGSGSADVYFKSGGHTPGRHITAHVGQATCSTDL